MNLVLTVLALCVGLPVRMDAARPLAELRERLVELNNLAVALQANADKDQRDLSADEIREVESYMAEFDSVEAEIARRERLEAQAARAASPQPRRVAPGTGSGDAPAAAREDDEPPAPAQRRAPAAIRSSRDRDRWGWGSFGQFAQAVISAAQANGRGGIDERLAVRMANPSSFGSEGVGADGGFAVPPEFRDAILEKVTAEDQLISRTDQLVSSSNTVTFPTDETTPWQTSGGVQAYWENEASAYTQSKPSLQNSTIKLNKLTALVGVTEELLSDAPAMDAYLRKKAPEKMGFKLNRAIVAGTGAGQPLGLLNSPAKVAVAAEGSQAADSIVFENIVKMWSRMYSSCWARSVWLANQDVLPKLLALNFISTDVTGATAFGGTPVYLPPGGLSNSPYGLLMGRPVIFTEACETVGDEGDLILADLSQYMTLQKVGGIRAETSMHLWFDYDIMAFKFVMRVAGQPWWSAPITPRASANTLSCIVTLAAR